MRDSNKDFLLQIVGVGEQGNCQDATCHSTCWPAAAPAPCPVTCGESLTLQHLGGKGNLFTFQL